MSLWRSTDQLDLSKEENVFNCSSSTEISATLEELVRRNDRNCVFFFVCQEDDGHVGLLAKIFSFFNSVSFTKISSFYQIGTDVAGKKFVATSLIVSNNN